MQVIIETEDKKIIKSLQPLITAAINYKGHFNASYTSKNSDFIVLDNVHRKHCLELLLKENNGFVIGSGSSHIWVSLHTASRVADKEPLAMSIHDRVLLIVDEK